MTTHLRTALAIAVGTVVAFALAYAGAVVFVLATMGIPLGAQPRTPTPGELGVLLAVAGAAALVGARAAARLAPGAAGRATGAVSVLLAAGALWGFSGRNAWPDWWGPAVAGVMVIGAAIGGRLRRRPGTGPPSGRVRENSAT